MITKNLDVLFEELKPLTLQQKQSFVMRMIGCLAPIVVEVHWNHAIAEAKKGLCNVEGEGTEKERTSQPAPVGKA